MTADASASVGDRPRPRILVVDDDEDVLVLLRHRLEHLGYAVTVATGGPQALEQLEAAPPSLMLLDLRLPRMSGLEVLHRVKQLSPETPVIVMTAFATVEHAVEAMREGARDFLTKPLTPGHLEVVVQKAFEAEALARAHRLAQEELDARTQSIIGDSPALQEAIARARRAAASPSTVLLLGESGTGKEVFARAIHAWSPRRACPFVVVNCAALSEELIASDLFGHEKGAFTGAHQRRQGKLELAAGGTIFLDEIGEMLPALQTRLLRVLQDHTFERVGGTAPIQVDIRVIAATNRDLTQAVRSGAFREDLFFRLNVIPIALPPLRERRGDIRRLAEFFLEHHRRKLKRPGLSLSANALDALERYHWPGNIRELENLLERAVVLSAGDELQPDELALPFPGPAEAEPAGASPYQARLDAAEKAMLEQALREHAGNRRVAARAMGIALSTLYAKLKKHSLT